MHPDEMVLPVGWIGSQVPGELLVLTMPDGTIELRHDDDGELVAAAFRDLVALRTSCGSGQPWTRMSVAEFECVADRLGVRLVALDAVPADDYRYPEAGDPELADLTPIDPVTDDGLLYIPSRPSRVGAKSVRVELQRHNSSHLCLLVYTSHTDLIAGCGPHQPWVAIRATDVARVAEEAGARRVLFNPVLQTSSRHQSAVANW